MPIAFRDIKLMPQPHAEIRARKRVLFLRALAKTELAADALNRVIGALSHDLRHKPNGKRMKNPGRCADGFSGYGRVHHSLRRRVSAHSTAHEIQTFGVRLSFVHSVRCET